MKRILTLSIALCAVLAAPPAPAAVKLTVQPGAGVYKEYLVSTDWYSLKIVEEVGARGVSFKLPPQGPEWIPQGVDYRSGGGLFVHNFTGRGYGTDQFPFGPRQGTVVKDTPQELVLRFVYASAGEPSETRTLTFAGDSPLIRVDTEFTNNTSSSFYRGLWPKVHAMAGGDIQHNAFFRADIHGQRVARWDEKLGQTVGRNGLCDNEFIEDATEGWMAQLNVQSGQGLVMLFDYNNLKTVYNCLPYLTAEWFYEDMPLRRDGGKWATTYWILPVEGWTSMAYASPRLLAGHQVVKAGEGVELTCAYARATEAVSEVSVKVAWRVLTESGGMKELPEQKIAALGAARSEFRLPLAGAPTGKSLLFAVTVTGKDGAGKAFTEKYDYVHEETDAQRFDLLAGVFIPVFTRPRPAQVRVYDKPSFRIDIQPGCPLLELRGPGFYRARVGEAAARAHIFDIKGSYLSRNFNGTALSYFPAGYEELQQYNTIVMNDTDAMCLKHFAREMVADFVRAGGGLLVIGGPYSLSNGRYGETQIGEILPVELTGQAFSWQPVKGKRTLEKAKGASLLKGVKLPAGMECLWMEEVKPRSGATVELTVGGKPFLICGEVKGPQATGRVAVMAGSVFGDSPKGFWEAAQWPGLLAVVLDWLNQNTHMTNVPWNPLGP